MPGGAANGTVHGTIGPDGCEGLNSLPPFLVGEALRPLRVGAVGGPALPGRHSLKGLDEAGTLEHAPAGFRAEGEIPQALEGGDLVFHGLVVPADAKQGLDDAGGH